MALSWKLTSGRSGCSHLVPTRYGLLHRGLSGDGPVHQNAVLDGRVSVEIHGYVVLVLVTVLVKFEPFSDPIIDIIRGRPFYSSPVYHESPPAPSAPPEGRTALK